ncbi:uncharacterized protein J4E92_000043 [Alternaria infectoria]|uniref:uncharacterized protein n=1 Tax=Alternaria infectoria TaxID=45303 RepID=UPI00221F2CE2|nr:uncharacterized protein J4E92_000043 [Alternaria infectoria]KAI4938762.1 hypothetical protein J4E92_000043 [Alternaria infectoria]
MHYGGGGPGQAIINTTSGALICYDVNNEKIYVNTDADTTNFQGNTNTISAADCHTLGDVTFRTSFNSASNYFQICTITYNGVDTEGVVTTDIDSGTVSVSSTYCTIYIPC